MTGTGTQADPYIVSEYTEFLTAIQTSGVYVKCADNTVWDMNIIDPTGERYHNSDKTINCAELDGNGAIVWNLHSAIGNLNVLFNIGDTIIKGLKFYNIDLNDGATFFKTTSNTAQIIDLMFTGQLNEQAVLLSGARVSKSLISVELFGRSKILDGSCSLEYSVINTPYISDNYIYSQYSFGNLSYCWFTGIFPFGRVTSGVNISSSSGNYNVINAEIRSEQLSFSLKGTYIINIDKYNFENPLTTYNNAILVTTEQLKDAEYLRSQGFPALSSNKG